MSLVTDPVILDSTGQDIVTQLATISAALAAGNIVTGNTDTTLSGVLQGANGKVAVKPVDSDPTADSTNLVSSGGTDKAIKGRVPMFGMGKNLLRNSDFTINQRGIASGSSSSEAKYTRDGWKTARCSYTFNNDGTMTYAQASSGYNAFLLQYVTEDLQNKQITVSAKIDGVLQSKTFIPGADYETALGGGVNVRCTYYSTGEHIGTEFQFKHTNSSGITIGPIKVELGSEQTLCHNEGTDANPVWVLNEIPDYEYELYRCMTSTADSSDTYANKTLATNDDVSVVPITVIPSSNIDTSILPFANYSYRVGRQVFINVSFSPAIARIQGQSFCAVPSALCPTQNFPVIASVVMRRTTTSKTWSAIATVYSTGRIGFPNQGGYDETNSLTNDAVIYIQGTYYI